MYLHNICFSNSGNFPTFGSRDSILDQPRKAVPNQAPQGSRILCSRELTSPRFPGSRIFTTDHPTTSMKCESSYSFRRREHHRQTFLCKSSPRASQRAPKNENLLRKSASKHVPQNFSGSVCATDCKPDSRHRFGSEL